MHSSGDYRTSWNIAVANADGTGLTEVTNFTGNESYPTWNYDGSMVLYWSTKDMPSAYQMNLCWQSPVSNPSNLKVILTQWVGEWVMGRASISSTGTLLYVSGSDMMDLHARDVGTSSDAVLRSESIRQAGKFLTLSAPTWSPDGLTIAFLEELKDTTTTGQLTFESVTVKVMDKEGKNVRTVIVAPAYGDNQIVQSLAWSPDGTKIAFTKPDGQLEAHIYVVNLDGSGFTAVTSAAGVTDLSISWSL